MVTVLQLHNTTLCLLSIHKAAAVTFQSVIALLLTFLVPDCMFHISAQSLFLQ